MEGSRNESLPVKSFIYQLAMKEWKEQINMNKWVCCSRNEWAESNQSIVHGKKRDIVEGTIPVRTASFITDFPIFVPVLSIVVRNLHTQI